MDTIQDNIEENLPAIALQVADCVRGDGNDDEFINKCKSMLINSYTLSTDDINSVINIIIENHLD